MIGEGDALGLARQGDMSGIDNLFKNGQYEECLAVAEKLGGDILNNYLE